LATAPARPPRASFHEHETARFIRETLASFGSLEIDRPTPTSVVARLRSGRPGRGLALRADIDALPIQEEGGVEFSSRTDGVMHACGHDGHTAMLLAVARLLVAAGSADNLIPETSAFGGTVRSYRQGTRERTRETIARILNGVTAAHGATYDLDYVEGYAPVVNDPRLATIVREAAGAERAAELEPLMAGDDFSAYLRVAPGCFFFVGAATSAHSRTTIPGSRSTSAHCPSESRRSLKRP
jgi:metal-dependent amidase/aminoacylase/carboxypeptidase family protein